MTDDDKNPADQPGELPGSLSGETETLPRSIGHGEPGPTQDLARADADPFADPGLPEHEPRRTDVDVRAARRAERQVAALFTVSALGTIGFIVAYYAIPKDKAVWIPLFGDVNAQTAAFGLSFGAALFCIGAGAIHWARTLMTDVDIVEERHPLRSTEEERAIALGQFRQGVEESGFGRRPLIRRSLLGALGVLALPAIVLLRDLGPLPRSRLRHTAWADEEHRQLINENTGEPIKPEHVTVGAMLFARPKGVEPSDLNEMAKSSVLLVRLEPEDIRSQREKDWGHEGIVCFSKICTHVGCPVGLYEQTTHHLLCPCHQSTFDMTDDGKVVFGPAARSLPQLAITVDAEGYLTARGDFAEPVGPSFWERG
jgi:ubiquinol-cytochrome c reductase iron-sulfur subunit